MSGRGSSGFSFRSMPRSATPLSRMYPTLKEYGCPDVPPGGIDAVAPKGLPPAVSKKLGEAIKKVTLEPSFQKVLTSFDVPYDYLDQEGLEKKIRPRV